MSVTHALTRFEAGVHTMAPHSGCCRKCCHFCVCMSVALTYPGRHPGKTARVHRSIYCFDAPLMCHCAACAHCDRESASTPQRMMASPPICLTRNEAPARINLSMMRLHILSATTLRPRAELILRLAGSQSPSYTIAMCSDHRSGVEARMIVSAVYGDSTPMSTTASCHASVQAGLLLRKWSISCSVPSSSAAN
eukprot:COSAG01_NODE_3966_length_5488_cov_65.012618_6_plen_194_part_00